MRIIAVAVAVANRTILCKPFSPREVVARVKAILRRASPDAYNNGAGSSIEMNEDRLQASIQGAYIAAQNYSIWSMTIIATYRIALSIVT